MRTAGSAEESSQLTAPLGLSSIVSADDRGLQPRAQFPAADHTQGQNRLEGFDERIIALYTPGMITRDICAYSCADCPYLRRSPPSPATAANRSERRVGARSPRAFSITQRDVMLLVSDRRRVWGVRRARFNIDS
jgi:hypothetical protein